MSIHGLPEAFACERCGRPILLGEINPGEAVNCPDCQHMHTATPDWVERLRSGVGARTLDDVQAAFSIPMSVGTGGPPPAGGAAGGGGGGAAGGGGMRGRGRNAGALTASQAGTATPGNLLTPNAPAAARLTPPSAPAAPAAPQEPDLPPRGPSWENPASDDSHPAATSDALPPWAIGGPVSGAPDLPALPDMHGMNDGAAAPAAGLPAFTNQISNLSDGAPEPWAAALPPMTPGTRVMGPPPSQVQRPDPASLVPRQIGRPDAGQWKGKLLRNEHEQSEADGRKFATMTAGTFAACSAVFWLFALSGNSQANGGLLPVWVWIAMAVGGVCAAMFTNGLARASSLLAIGLVPPLVALVQWLMLPPIPAAAAGMPGVGSIPLLFYAALVLIPLTMLTYGASAASAQAPTSDWIRSTAAISAFSMIGLVLWILTGMQDMLNTMMPGGFGGGMMRTGMGMAFTVIAAIMCAAPMLACLNYWQHSQRIAYSVNVVFWVSAIGPWAFFGMFSSFTAALLMAAMMGTAIGWMFVGGAGARDLIMYYDLQQRAKRANVRLNAPPAFGKHVHMYYDEGPVGVPDKDGYFSEPESGEPFSG
ncbi:MAG: hypothetical protein AB7K09_06600 [Planctomycetota bacterium]